MGLNQKQLAGKLGVSQMTISRVMNNRAGVSSALRERISSIARNSGYVHDKIAMGLRGNSIRLVGLIIPDVNNSFFPQITTAIERRASEEGYQILLAHSHESYDQENHVINLLRGFRVDGFIIAPSGTENQIGNYTVLQKFKIPFVFIDRYKKKIRTGAVVTDVENGSLQLGRYLIRKGYRKWGYLEGPAGVSSSNEHKRGLQRSLCEITSKGHQLVSVTAGFGEKDGFRAVQELLKKFEPDVIIGVNDPVAIGAYRYLKHKNIRVPQDIALAGFSDLKMTALLEVPLTTVREFTAEIGKKAFNLLLEMIRNHKPAYQTIRLKPELVVRDSA